MGKNITVSEYFEEWITEFEESSNSKFPFRPCLKMAYFSGWFDCMKMIGDIHKNLDQKESPERVRTLFYELYNYIQKGYQGDINKLINEYGHLDPDEVLKALQDKADRSV